MADSKTLPHTAVKNGNGEYEIREVDKLDNINMEPTGETYPNGAIRSRPYGIVQEDSIFSPGIAENIPAPEYGDLEIPEGYYPAYTYLATLESWNRLFLPNKYPPNVMRPGDAMFVFGVNNYYILKGFYLEDTSGYNDFGLRSTMTENERLFDTDRGVCTDYSPAQCYNNLTASNRHLQKVVDSYDHVSDPRGQIFDFVRLSEGLEYTYVISGIEPSTGLGVMRFSTMFRNYPSLRGDVIVGFASEDSSLPRLLNLGTLDSGSISSDDQLSSQWYVLKMVRDGNNMLIDLMNRFLSDSVGVGEYDTEDYVISP